MSFTRVVCAAVGLTISVAPSAATAAQPQVTTDVQVEVEPAARPAATTTSSPAVEAEIEALLTRLGSEDWPVRKAAQERLVALGEAAEPHLLRAARASEDAEVRTRCEAALQQIADNRLVGPTLITMHLADVAPRVAFEELGKQAGIELRPQNPSLWNQQLPNVSLHVDRLPFWEVVRVIHEQCGLDVDGYGSSGLSVMQTRGRAAPVAIHGPFRVRATRISRTRSVDLATGNTPTNDFSLMLTVTAEPKLRVTSGGGIARVESAEDENGASLIPEGGAGAIGGGAVMMPGAIVPPGVLRTRTMTETSARSATASWPVTVRLRYPQEAGQRITRLRGATSCAVIVSAETLEVPDILAAADLTKQVGDTEVTIKSCRKTNEQYELTLALAGEAPVNGVARFGRSGNEGVRLIDDQGRDMDRLTGRTTTSNEKTEFQLRYRAPAGGAAPAKLVWQVPTEVRNIEVPFEFKDLPLP